MTTIPEFSPGCFGSAVAFKKEDTVCRACPFAEMCEPAHMEAQTALRERYGIRTTQQVLSDAKQQREAEKAARQAAKDPATLVLPKKTQDLIDRLDRGNYDVKGKFSRGENPFGQSMRFMQIVGHLLIHLKNARLDRQLLAAAFVKKLEWQQGTADAHARMAIQALEHIGAITNNDGVIALKG
ncbi:hypothetical protein B9J07_28195 [Sinorhizobium sp. LM21]|uniref:hypothetical protein n=1 Tax=Sinorhizobium sp. LM21 TaxID=1449788 RepID=UPI0005D736FE|nr:hypothetical protein [Sinorhizobium sp. LM21]AJW30128.1 hypothetical protein pLM21S1_p7 [Sinorhizobium sp. LM21]OWZ90469.1 hypothetical protein B9J07_28195 [Sinorhizobium sp. LM21]